MSAAEQTTETPTRDSLNRLDARLCASVEAARALTGREPGADPFRGLYVSEGDFLRYLSGEDSGTFEPRAEPLAVGGRFARLAAIFALEQFELDVLLIALAPEIAPRYERIFSYLQDDVSRKRPCVDVILTLLCGTRESKLSGRIAFGASGGLMHHGLIRLAGDELVPLPRREVCIDSRVAEFLLGDDTLDARLAGFVTVAEGARLPQAALTAPAPPAMYFQGADEEVRRDAAMELARECGAELLIAEVGRAARGCGDFESWLAHLSREARLRQAMVCCEGVDSLDEAGRESLLRVLAGRGGVTVLSGARKWKADASRFRGLITVPFEMPDWRDRRRVWESALRDHGLHARGTALDGLAESFRFTRSQIADASAAAANLAQYRRQRMRVTHVFEAARMRSGNDMGNLATRVPAARGWDDIVLPAETTEQLREICRRVTLRRRVQDEWGFARRFPTGRGVNALFHGHSGTGKTMAAEVIAQELELELYKIDLAGVVSKYIGETEKNLERIFATAENANVILFFDEADALFGKRSEVRDSHDRYANLEISYLLQKMEAYEGLSILATNLRQNLDDAFLRRLAFTIAFPFPDEPNRRKIWGGIWPKNAPLEPDVDCDWLGDRFLMSGGNIRNAAVGAAFLAAEEGGAVSMAHVLRAIRSEFLKMGRTLTAAELTPPAVSQVGA